MSRFTRGGTERSAKRKGGVASRLCVSGEKEMLCSSQRKQRYEMQRNSSVWVLVRAMRRRRNFLYLGRNGFFFNILKCFPLLLMGTKRLCRFLGVVKKWILSIGGVSLLMFARHWRKRRNFQNLVDIALFFEFLEGLLGQVVDTNGCVNHGMQWSSGSYLISVFQVGSRKRPLLKNSRFFSFMLLY